VRLACAASLALAGVAVLIAPAAQAADRYERSFRWSGYRWSVRSTTGRADPGHNRWDDTRNNVRVRRDGTLRVNITKGRAVDVVGPRTGYGRYRWTVETDLSTVDPFRVAAFFVHGTRGEQDVEFSRWGDPALSTAGSWVTWRRGKRLGFGFFAVTPSTPYTIVIDRKVGRTRFVVRAGTGATLLDTTFPSSAGGRHIAPHISYWLYPGSGARRSPFTTATVHPPIIVRSFRYTKSRG
jgi:hypothetical protein